MEEVDLIDRMTIPDFLVRKSPITFEEQLRFGAIARRLNQAYGVRYKMVMNRDFGEVRSYSLSMLEIAWAQFERTRQRHTQLALFAEG